MQFSIYVLRVQINKSWRVLAGGEGVLTTTGIVFSLVGLVMGLLQHLSVGLPIEVPKRSLIPNRMSRDLLNRMVFIYLHCGLLYPQLHF